MNKYRLVNNEDVNNFIDLHSTSREECVYEALNEIGWSVVETTELCEDQLTFDFTRRS